MWDPYRAGAHCITIQLLNLLTASQGIVLHGHVNRQKQACLFCFTFCFHLESFWPLRAAVYILSLKAEPQGEGIETGLDGLRLTLVEMFTYQLRNKKKRKKKKK